MLKTPDAEDTCTRYIAEYMYVGCFWVCETLLSMCDISEYVWHCWVCVMFLSMWRCAEYVWRCWVYVTLSMCDVAEYTLSMCDDAEYMYVWCSWVYVTLSIRDIAEYVWCENPFWNDDLTSLQTSWSPWLLSGAENLRGGWGVPTGKYNVKMATWTSKPWPSHLSKHYSG